MASIYQRKDGRWVVSYSINGKRVSKYAWTEAKARAVLASLTPAPTLNQPLTLSSWAERWLTLKAAEVRAVTLQEYQRCLAPVLPLLGSVPLGSLTRLQLASLLASFHEGGTLKAVRAFKVLRLVFQDAVRYEVLAVSPLNGVKRPRYTSQARQYWTVDEAKRALDTALLPHPRQKYRPLLALMLLTGLRVSEVKGLTWECVDLDRGTLRVEATAYHIPGIGWVSETPKSLSSRRVLSLSPTLLSLLQSLPLPHAGPVFRAGPLPTGEGNPKDKRLPPGSSQICASLKFLCRDAGVPRINPHGLRHVHTILTIQATGDVHAAQRRLGHASVSTTMRMYAYAHTADKDVATSLDRILGRGDTP